VFVWRLPENDYLCSFRLIQGLKESISNGRGSFHLQTRAILVMFLIKIKRLVTLQMWFRSMNFRVNYENRCVSNVKGSLKL
jgi:hypothetical protein